MKPTITILTTLTLSFGAPVTAGPDETIKALMNEPATMLDLGILKLQLHLNQVESNPFRKWNVIYNWDDNTIDLNTYSHSKADVKDAKDTCSEIVTGLRSEAGYKADGSVILGISSFAYFFDHMGWQVGSNEEVRERQEDLEKKFRIRITDFVTIEGGPGRLECTARLPGTSFATEVQRY